jgi:hypothetical protein
MLRCFRISPGVAQNCAAPSGKRCFMLMRSWVRGLGLSQYGRVNQNREWRPFLCLEASYLLDLMSGNHTVFGEQQHTSARAQVVGETHAFPEVQYVDLHD